MLKRNTKPLILANLTLVGQGDSVSFNVTYNNIKQSEVDAAIQQIKDSDNGAADLVLRMVKEWETEFPLTVQGIREAEDEYPGFIMAVVEGFHEARRVAKRKN